MNARRRLPLTCTLLWAAIAACGFAWEAPSTRVLDPQALERQTLELAPKVQAATVGIVLSEEDIEANGIGYAGSGVIVSAEGLVLTAAHVLEGCGADVVAL